MKELINEIIVDITKLRQELHETPEPAFHEYRTKEMLMSFIKKHTCHNPKMSIVDRGSWFYVEYASDSGDAIAFRADMDAVTGKDGKPGHYCGHDGHSSILAGLAVYISRVDPGRPVYLIFQPAEEIGQGAAVCSSLFNTVDIKEMYGLHNIPGYDKGSILIRHGTFACASTGMEITYTGTPSHAAYPDKGRNPADAIARLILYRHELLEGVHQGIVLITVIGTDIGSDAYGVSAGSGVLRLTVRAEKASEYRKLIAGISSQAKKLAEEYDLGCDIRYIEEFPSTENDEDCIARVETAAWNAGLKTVYPEEPMRWSEDFGCYLNSVKGAMFGVGAGTEHSQLHTEKYEFPDDIMEPALRLYCGLI